MSEMDKVLGFEKLCLVHLNDSAKPMGSRADKHAGLGEGLMGKDFFYNILHDKRFKNTPFILEAPGDMASYQKDIEFVRDLAAQRKFRL
jgi:deoxyribonuclease-4